MKNEILQKLKTSVLGQSLHVFEEAASTNDLARERARAGGSEGETFLALGQTAGRGRLGRAWESPAGKNLLMSVLLKPKIELSEAFLLTLVAGAAVFDLFASYLQNTLDLAIKWPNDVYWKGRKAAGILCEMESDGGVVRYVVCGAGININADASDFSPYLCDKTTSLKDAAGRDIPLPEAAARFLNFLEARYQNFLKEGSADLIRFCNDHSYLRGRKVLFEAPEGQLLGIAHSLTPQGLLLVEMHDGSLVPISSGDVTVKEIAKGSS